MIFETERLRIRKLKLSDIEGFYELESNPKVLQYATGEAKSFEGCKTNLQEVIEKYDKPNNDFWIYAAIRKQDNAFVGTVAFVKEGVDDEIGYRLVERFWGNGYGYEVCKGMITYAKQLEMPKLIGNVVDENIASAKILVKLGFTPIEHFVSEDIKLPETKYELIL
ncbi:GNAT family N-acetyltransferase [Tenacibaculum sp. IB213877]|uniref:GNAT family N-acetyltransferase n=1 Tax=Tenacibaculum sp. IB213877 TaxID=3097351 RepID=UPI002A59B41E|nr:GNAT family N-acetyltransferase [Tenacibaculum sp. IB213877]MDY0779875.1 GNAT family N-acetyltransferase [Tenacibaculum sp. IB213877]